MNPAPALHLDTMWTDARLLTAEGSDSAFNPVLASPLQVVLRDIFSTRLDFAEGQP
ncbi:hypothetical protein [Sphingobium sp. Sx8-8]|uniref:hypothetical protein n=1 Tax=Sphingobium sp. Sx8-8 TaxID=2933617 RepID=UPI001F59ACAC|nr:hypothetical protein [Sphingobium sp. Sx8-8]